ncbi:MAG TPA: phosphoglucosamine mutase, partial [Candidatus Thermoplasmatota archaeon]|nr:phosphoglucosamine mutase [Candidatus Thermoplasmatota archaeon]
MARFGSSGIRGRYGTEVTEDLAFRVGAAIAERSRRVAVGRDARVSSPSLAQAMIEGCMAAGAEVVDAGLVPTPTLAYAARSADAGVM